MAEGGHRNHRFTDVITLRRVNRSRESNRQPCTSIICRYNLQGRCRFGERCRNIHSGTIFAQGREQRNGRSDVSMLSDVTGRESGLYFTQQYQTYSFDSTNDGGTTQSQMISQITTEPDSYQLEYSRGRSILPLVKDSAVASPVQSYADVLKCSATPPNGDSSDEEGDRRLDEKKDRRLDEEEDRRLNEKEDRSLNEEEDPKLDEEDPRPTVEQDCCVCHENVMKKEPNSERVFGILEKCAHVFCYNCIKKWMRNESTDHHSENYGSPAWRVSCPMCRLNSYFIMRSEEPTDVERHSEVIANYKSACAEKHCKYYNRGGGVCKLGSLCLYRHVTLDGTVVVMPRPIISLPFFEYGLEFLGPLLAEFAHVENVDFELALPNMSPEWNDECIGDNAIVPVDFLELFGSDDDDVDDDDVSDDSAGPSGSNA